MMINETAIKTDELDWLEDKNGFSRYALSNEESIWVCSCCGREGDPYEEEGCEECSNVED